jgi:hypothetical protein
MKVVIFFCLRSCDPERILDTGQVRERSVPARVRYPFPVSNKQNERGRQTGSLLDINRPNIGQPRRQLVLEPFNHLRIPIF